MWLPPPCKNAMACLLEDPKGVPGDTSPAWSASSSAGLPTAPRASPSHRQAWLSGHPVERELALEELGR
jgi:hypothetical protein